MQYYKIDLKSWDKALEHLISSFNVYASVKNDSGQDYELLTNDLIPFIVYNTPKPATPLKNFFLPVKENVSIMTGFNNRRIIIGIPNCDLEGLKLLDEIYLSEDMIDTFYRIKRENTILIASDCFHKQEHCHCSHYGVKPYSEGIGDVSLALVDGYVILNIFSAKGEELLKEISNLQWVEEADSATLKIIEEKHASAIGMITGTNEKLPGYYTTGELIKNSDSSIWQRYASTCVSCGACSAICPTCSCFLLIDKPGFEKVKQLDTCQYPGFERVAGGADALHRLHVRFRNRYLCKYVWKPEKYKSIACTGCGRCIEACLGKINKNELFIDLVN